MHFWRIWPCTRRICNSKLSLYMYLLEWGGFYTFSWPLQSTLSSLAQKMGPFTCMLLLAGCLLVTQDAISAPQSTRRLAMPIFSVAIEDANTTVEEFTNVTFSSLPSKLTVSPGLSTPNHTVFVTTASVKLSTTVLKTPTFPKTTKFRRPNGVPKEGKTTPRRRPKLPPAARVTLPSVLPLYTGLAFGMNTTPYPWPPVNQQSPKLPVYEDDHAPKLSTDRFPELSVVIQTVAACLTAAGERLSTRSLWFCCQLFE